MGDRIHITTAIFYSNGPPHVGHAGEAIAADTFARYYRRKLGRDNVSFVTGTDEHGEKNYRAAKAQNLSPKAFADKISAQFKESFAALGIDYDFFVRTTDPAHEKFVQKMLARHFECDEIYFKNYEGLYCIGCERYYTGKELLPGNICPEHKTVVETVREANFFLKLEKYRAAIRDHIERNPDFIRPQRYRNEALRMLDEPLSDLCISRPKARLDWGIELPFDTNYVTYVWYDAFWAYLSELPDTDDSALKKILPLTEHFIGKDILKTHAVYWPAMLMAVGLPLYRSLNVHGFMNFGGERFSKSSGNMMDPVRYEREYGKDVLRYFLLRDVVYGLDADFSEERIVDRYNADLANNLGNLLSRVLSMAARYFNGEVTANPGAGREEIDTDLHKIFQTLPDRAAMMVEELAFSRALETIWNALDAANKYVVATAPFTLAKDPSRLPRVAEILANLLEGLRVAADTLHPFMPAASQQLLELLSVAPGTARLPFGTGIKKGHRVKPATPLFPRIDKAARK
ncbi:MAG TPA: methionine--tRNA ligase [Candidatus Binataceae bacterium]